MYCFLSHWTDEKTIIIGKNLKTQMAVNTSLSVIVPHVSITVVCLIQTSILNIFLHLDLKVKKKLCFMSTPFLQRLSL